MSRPKPLRGEIWMIDLNPKKGHEQQGVRPCLIVSTNSLNRSNFGTVIVCPITTVRRPRFKWRVGLNPEDLGIADATWKPRPHWVETDQLVTIDTSQRVLRQLAKVTNEIKLSTIDSSLRMMLSL